MKAGEGTCLQNPRCKASDTLFFNFQREGVLPSGHQIRRIGHDGKVKQALRPWNLLTLRQVICKKLKTKPVFTSVTQRNLL